MRNNSMWNRYHRSEMIRETKLSTKQINYFSRFNNWKRCNCSFVPCAVYIYFENKRERHFDGATVCLSSPIRLCYFWFVALFFVTAKTAQSPTILYSTVLYGIAKLTLNHSAFHTKHTTYEMKKKYLLPIRLRWIFKSD